MSGVFAGALAAGLAISAINPDFAGRFFASVSGGVSELIPRTNLIDAIANGDLPVVRARLAEGADPNALDPEGSPVLLRAARAGNLAAVSLLLQAGADPTLPTQDGRSILHRVAQEGRSLALLRMIEAGAPIDLAGGVYGCLTPLSLAAANGRVRAASLLAERGASLDPQNGCSVGPMEIAASHSHVLARLEQIRAERLALLRLTVDPPARNPAPQLDLQSGAAASTVDQDGPLILNDSPFLRNDAIAVLWMEGEAPAGSDTETTIEPPPLLETAVAPVAVPPETVRAPIPAAITTVTPSTVPKL